jgi:hypothetical protein
MPVALVIQHAKHMSHIAIIACQALTYHILPTLSHKQHVFFFFFLGGGGESYQTENVCFDLLYNSV